MAAAAHVRDRLWQRLAGAGQGCCRLLGRLHHLQAHIAQVSVSHWRSRVCKGARRSQDGPPLSEPILRATAAAQTVRSASVSPAHERAPCWPPGHPVGACGGPGRPPDHNCDCTRTHGVTHKRGRPTISCHRQRDLSTPRGAACDPPAAAAAPCRDGGEIRAQTGAGGLGAAALARRPGAAVVRVGPRRPAAPRRQRPGGTGAQGAPVLLPAWRHQARCV